MGCPFSTGPLIFLFQDRCGTSCYPAEEVGVASSGRINRFLLKKKKEKKEEKKTVLKRDFDRLEE